MTRMSVSPFMFAGGFPANPQSFGYYNAIPAQAAPPAQYQTLPQWAIPPYLGGGGTPQYAVPNYGVTQQPAYGGYPAQQSAYPSYPQYAAPQGYTPQSAYPSYPSFPSAVPMQPTYSPQAGYTGGQSFPPQTTRPNIPVLFRPVIVQNQHNQLPLRNLGGLNAVMNAAALLNINPGQQVY